MLRGNCCGGGREHEPEELRCLSVVGTARGFHNREKLEFWNDRSHKGLCEVWLGSAGVSIPSRGYRSKIVVILVWNKVAPGLGVSLPCQGFSSSSSLKWAESLVIFLEVKGPLFVFVEELVRPPWGVLFKMGRPP